MVPGLIPDDSYGRVTFTRPIELREVDPLPGPERDRAVAYGKRHRRADQDRFHVRRAVSLGVRVRRVARDRALERGEDVLLHIRVGVFVHEHPGGRVCDRHRDDAVGDRAPRHRGFDPGGDVDRLFAPLARDGDLLVTHSHARAVALSRAPAIRAMSEGVALPPLTTSTVLRPRGSIRRARSAARGAAPEGSTKRESDSRYS